MRSLLPHVVVGALPDPAVLEILARDSDLSVVNSVDARLRGLASVGPLPTEAMALKPGWRVMLNMSTAWDDAYLPALRRRLDNPVVSRDVVGGVIQVAARTAQGAEFLARWACDGAEPTQAAWLVVYFSSDVSWDRGVTPWDLIDPERARELLAVAWSTPPEPAAVRAVAKCMLDRPDYRTSAAGWLADESLPASVRFLGAWVSAPDADDTWRAEVLALLSTADPVRREELRACAGNVQDLAKIVGDRGVAGRLIGDAAESSAIPEEVEEFLVEGLAERAELSQVIAEHALARWSSRAPRFDATFQLAAAKVQASEEDPKLALFEGMLRAPASSFTWATLQAVGRMHLRAHLPLLRRALAGDFLVNEKLRSNQQARAAEALACYLDDEAAEILLRGVGATTDPSVRDACFAALDTIRRYQDERARWNSRADAGRARSEAIAELVGLIEAGDAVQKVEAVRALGTLEALEELPRLVRLAASRDAALAKAAKEALERIHAAGAKD